MLPLFLIVLGFYTWLVYTWHTVLLMDDQLKVHPFIKIVLCLQFS